MLQVNHKQVLEGIPLILLQSHRCISFQEVYLANLFSCLFPISSKASVAVWDLFTRGTLSHVTGMIVTEEEKGRTNNNYALPAMGLTQVIFISCIGFLLL